MSADSMPQLNPLTQPAERSLGTALLAWARSSIRSIATLDLRYEDPWERKRNLG